MAKAKGGENTVQQVENLVRPIIEQMGLELWDVRFEKEGPDWYLRVLIDPKGEGPLDMNTCEAASRAIDPVIEAADPIDQGYFLEVGSPGLGRRMTRPEHFAKYMGQKIAARLIRPDENGCREYAGILAGFEGQTVTLEAPEGTVQFELPAASFVKLCDDENLF